MSSFFPFPNPCNAADVCTFHARECERVKTRESPDHVENSNEYRANLITKRASLHHARRMGHSLKLINYKITRAHENRWWYRHSSREVCSEGCPPLHLRSSVFVPQTRTVFNVHMVSSNDVTCETILRLLPSVWPLTGFPRACPGNDHLSRTRLRSLFVEGERLSIEHEQRERHP